MRILHLAMHEDTGAGRAAMRLHEGLLQLKEDSLVLTGRKTSNLKSVYRPSFLNSTLKETQFIVVNKVVSRKLNAESAVFSTNVTPSKLLKQIKAMNPDVINLHWVGWEFIRIEDLKKLGVPIVWTLQDMWPFTGGCHYSQTCDRYTQSCGNCPELTSHKQRDLSNWVWQRKAKAWKNLDLTIAAPSQWIADCAQKSSLFRDLQVEVIPFCLNTQKYRPISQKTARDALNLPDDKLLILFGALRATDDYRKGFHLLQAAIQELNLSGWGTKAEIAVFGSPEPENPIDLGFKIHYLDHLSDDLSLALVYSAADVMIVPSLQESFGQTASESLACGTPVVAFNATGLKDILDHRINGYLVEPYQVDDLARGIAWVLEDPERRQLLRQNARKKAETSFSLNLQAQQYTTLYSTLLERNLTKK
jgi:glycosyltransferase involved in cell wall biosynthesis